MKDIIEESLRKLNNFFESIFLIFGYLINSLGSGYTILHSYYFLWGTSNSKHDWTPIKYLNVLNHNRTQKHSQYFFLNILQKYYELPILDILDMSGHFHQKQ